MEGKTIDELKRDIASCMSRDRFTLRRLLRKTQDKKTADPAALKEISERISQSVALAQQRIDQFPLPELDESLPIYHRRDEIVDAINKHQVVVISGETGSGKSTQLPLIALQMGIGKCGFIGHTQPRRIAARSVSNRIASQLKTKLGDKVGFKIRFDDQTSDSTFVKLMTDGILLAETQSDRFLDQYEMIIIDEAHERSLNIDFLIGNLKKILSKRRDLKLLVTSATIDTERFANHFRNDESQEVPIINVEGRTYPVEMRYQPPVETDARDDGLNDHVVDSVRDIVASEDGDVLVFLPTEKDIKTISKKLKGTLAAGAAVDILPLYARLSNDQQNAIFNPGARRRIVLATNVAESSITVPRIRIVVDSGTARISRYAARSKVQRLPIEPISQASANQRAGRCGRIGPGVCVRLFSEDDFAERPQFTTPEIRRTNLASIILQTLALKLGDIAEFPFIDPPLPEAIRDGYKTLFEIGAIDRHRRLTPIGRWLARLPIDPRIGRMLYAANDEGCLHEILIIASALEVQDPRIRPAEKQQAADQQHEKFKHEKSDFMSYLSMWDFVSTLKNDLSRSKFRIACKQNFLSLNLIHQWQEIHRQLKSMIRQAGFKAGKRKDDYNAIHRSLLAGLLSGIAMLGDKHEYTGAGGVKFHLWPGSGIFASKPKWLVASEIVETTKRYGRTAAKIDPQWIEPLAEHLAKYHFVDPHWSEKQQTVMAYENVSLFGLPIVNRRKKHYGKIDPELSRQLFIEHGLIEYRINAEFGFLTYNFDKISSLENSVAKTRRRDMVLDTAALTEFYRDRLPENIYDVQSLRRAIKRTPELDQNLRIDYEIEIDGMEDTTQLFPDSIEVGGLNLPVDYRFEPGHQEDGATVSIPAAALSQINEAQAGWLIPGLNEAKIVAMIKSLPKDLRRQFVPAPETAKKVVQQLSANQGRFEAAVANALSRLAGQTVTPEAFDQHKVDQNLFVNFRIVDEHGEQVAAGRSINELRKSIGIQGDTFVRVEDDAWHADGLNSWSWDELPKEVAISRGATQLMLHPAVVDQNDCVGLRLVDTIEFARQTSRQGLTRLFVLRTKKSLKKQINWLPDFQKHSVLLSRQVAPDALKTGLMDMIARMVVVDGQKKLPANKEAFEEIVSGSVESIAIATQKIAKWLPQWSQSFHKAYLSLESLSEKFSSSKTTVKQQIKTLTKPDFLTTTPWLWLQHYPRYFDGIETRCQKLDSGGLADDREFESEIADYWQHYLTHRQNHDNLSIYDAELEKFRWMVEEFRVSKFAQKLGTSLTVSSVRLDKQLKKIKVV